MEYLYGQSWNGKNSFIKCLEEDLEDQSALYNIVYCFEFLDQKSDAISYIKIHWQKSI
jgi:hypothetical protein